MKTGPRHFRKISKRERQQIKNLVGSQRLIVGIFGGSPKDVSSDVVALTHTLSKVMATLNEREEDVLRMRFQTPPKTLEKIGKHFSVTRERIRQIEAKALRKLRHPTRSRLLRKFASFPAQVDPNRPSSSHWITTERLFCDICGREAFSVINYVSVDQSPPAFIFGCVDGETCSRDALDLFFDECPLAEYALSRKISLKDTQ